MYSIVHIRENFSIRKCDRFPSAFTVAPSTSPDFLIKTIYSIYFIRSSSRFFLVKSWLCGDNGKVCHNNEGGKKKKKKKV